ncbi:MAG: hypothetical protein V4612_00885 [Pseudomonadota bacterium]
MGLAQSTVQQSPNEFLTGITPDQIRIVLPNEYLFSQDPNEVLFSAVSNNGHRSYVVLISDNKRPNKRVVANFTNFELRSKESFPKLKTGFQQIGGNPLDCKAVFFGGAPDGSHFRLREHDFFQAYILSITDGLQQLFPDINVQYQGSGANLLISGGNNTIIENGEQNICNFSYQAILAGEHLEDYEKRKIELRATIGNLELDLKTPEESLSVDINHKNEQGETMLDAQLKLWSGYESNQEVIIGLLSAGAEFDMQKAQLAIVKRLKYSADDTIKFVATLLTYGVEISTIDDNPLIPENILFNQETILTIQKALRTAQDLSESTLKNLLTKQRRSFAMGTIQKNHPIAMLPPEIIDKITSQVTTDKYLRERAVEKIKDMELLLANYTKDGVCVLNGQLRSYEIKDIVKALEINTTITSLILVRSQIGDEGAKALSEVLKTNTTLTDLNLAGNKIGDEGAKALSEVLKTNTTLTDLSLGQNKIGDEGFIEIAKAVVTNPEFKIKIFFDHPVQQQVFNELMRIKAENLIILGHSDPKHPLSKLPSDVMALVLQLASDQPEGKPLSREAQILIEKVNLALAPSKSIGDQTGTPISSEAQNEPKPQR